ncbi:MAG TPA: glycosyltransferase family 2 protein, partial [Nitrososphaerales archaeon]|nr:glycosyltransferase family 2 protein [Nitrososphaerales archaeon]
MVSLVSVIIPTRNRVDKLARCLESVYRSAYPRIEVIVVDDASERPVEQALSGKFPGTKFIRNPSRRLLSCSRNTGAAASLGEYLFFLDDDNVIDAGAVSGLVDCFARENVAVSSPMIYYLAQPEKVWTSYIVKGRFPGFYTLHTDVPRTTRDTFSFHNCYSDDTQVLTDEGWKLFKEVDGQRIFSLNPDTLTPEWVDYTEKI